MRKRAIYIKIKKYKVKWNKILVSFVSVGGLWWSLKVFFMLFYELSGTLKWLMPVIDYSNDSKYYYIINSIHQMEYGKQIICILLVADVILFIGLFLLIIKQNTAKKLLIIEHTSSQNMSFSYNKEELAEYEEKRFQINQYATISNQALPLVEKVSLLITEIQNALPKINEYINRGYQIGYAGIPVGNIPSAFMLGFELDDANKKLYFHKNRFNPSDDDFHLLPDMPVQIRLHLDKKENNLNEPGKLLVLVQLTQKINDYDLQGIIEENDYVLKYGISDNIDYDIINSANQTNIYVQQILNGIADIQKHPNISTIKICIAASSDFVFALGTKFSTTQNIETVVYQFSRDWYEWGINVTKKTPVLNQVGLH